jgi:hypothetical protein
MAEHLSEQHAVNSIKLIYQHGGFIIPAGTPGASVTREFGDVVGGTELAALYVFIDEYIALFRYSGYYFMSAIAHSGPRAATFYRLAARQARNLASIRLLCGAGLDTNARMVLRLLYETSLLWSRFIIDEVARKEFDLCADPQKSNAFWHKYLSKEKTEKYLAAQADARGLTWLGNLKEQMDDMKAKISLSAHPTFLTAYFDSRTDFEVDEGFALGKPARSSHFTLTTALFAAVLPFAIKPEIGYGLDSVDLRSTPEQWPPVHAKQISWEEYNQALRDLFPGLWLMACRFADGLRSQAEA